MCIYDDGRVWKEGKRSEKKVKWMLRITRLPVQHEMKRKSLGHSFGVWLL